MSVDKFRFVSPGVFVNEIDNSQLPKLPGDVGPVIIGRSQRGPVMRPVKVQSFSDFVDVFGEPSAGGIGGDVWRDGNKSAPTYGAYAAQAYLKNSNPITFVRLAGYEHPDKVSGEGEAGWATDNAFGLFVMPIVGSGDVYTSAGNATASLAAIIYTNLSETDIELQGKQLSGSTSGLQAEGTWVRSVGPNLEFKIQVVNNEGNPEVKTVNFDENSKKYIRTVLNTNPILTNDNILTSPEQYFLGETFKSFVNDNSPIVGGADSFAGVLVRLKKDTCSQGNNKVEAQDAMTGWVVSQHKGDAASFVPNANGLYPVQQLFRLVSLTEGEWNSKNLKVSIEDIKEPPNEFIKYGSFTVSVRKIDDTDLNPVYLERFVNVTLDPSSDSYIAKKIGDKYTEWDYSTAQFKEYGNYNNKSKFIRVEMNQEVDAGITDPDYIPFGFYGPELYMNKAPLSTVSVGAVFNQASITGNNVFTASFQLPEVPTLDSTDMFPYPSFNNVYWGFRTTISGSKRFNKDTPDYLHARPSGYDVVATKPSFLFSLDDVSGSLSGSVIKTNVPAVWKEGNRKNGLSFSEVTGSDKNRVILSTFNKFTMPLFGGSDGVDITEKDPFNKRALVANAGNATTNYAFNSVKVAVESISDPEVVEMNLASMPGIDNKALTTLLVEKCEARGDALAVIDLEGDYTPEEGKASAGTTSASRKPNVDNVIANLKDRAMNTSYGCSFFPWVLIRDTINNNTVWVPSSVAALGTFSSSQRKTELWFAPAGFNRGGLTDGAAGIPVVQTSLRLTSKDRDRLYETNINPIATFPSEGIVIFGQKTLQVTPSALDRINVRRLMIYLKKQISRFATTVLFDPNVAVTWKRFTNLADPFLQSVQSRFGLQEYKVILDETTTTPELVDRNVVYAKILLKPTRAIEFIALDFVITNSGASFND